jgi:hypothetical protein
VSTGVDTTGSVVVSVAVVAVDATESRVSVGTSVADAGLATSVGSAKPLIRKTSSRRAQKRSP